MERAGIVLIITAFSCATAFGPPTWAFATPNGVTVRDLIPLANWQKQFKITDGKDQGKLVPLTFQNGTREGWSLSFGDYAGVHLRNDTTGALMMERLDLFKKSQLHHYEPALPILTRDIDSSVSILRQANFKMYDRDTGKLKRTGHASHLVKRISRSQFRNARRSHRRLLYRDRTSDGHAVRSTAHVARPRLSLG